VAGFDLLTRMLMEASSAADCGRIPAPFMLHLRAAPIYMNRCCAAAGTQAGLLALPWHSSQSAAHPDGYQHEGEDDKH